MTDFLNKALDQGAVRAGSTSNIEDVQITSTGSARRRLANGVFKEPDFSVLDISAPESDGSKCPTLVMEIAYSESTREVHESCAQWILHSKHPGVLLAIAVDFVWKGKTLSHANWVHWQSGEAQILSEEEAAKIHSKRLNGTHPYPPNDNEKEGPDYVDYSQITKCQRYCTYNHAVLHDKGPVIIRKIAEITYGQKASQFELIAPVNEHRQCRLWTLKPAQTLGQSLQLSSFIKTWCYDHFMIPQK